MKDSITNGSIHHRLESCESLSDTHLNESHGIEPTHSSHQLSLTDLNSLTRMSDREKCSSDPLPSCTAECANGHMSMNSHHVTSNHALNGEKNGNVHYFHHQQRDDNHQAYQYSGYPHGYSLASNGSNASLSYVDETSFAGPIKSPSLTNESMSVPTESLFHQQLPKVVDLQLDTSWMARRWWNASVEESSSVPSLDSLRLSEIGDHLQQSLGDEHHLEPLSSLCADPSTDFGVISAAAAALICSPAHLSVPSHLHHQTDQSSARHGSSVQYRSANMFPRRSSSIQYRAQPSASNASSSPMSSSYANVSQLTSSQAGLSSTYNRRVSSPVNQHLRRGVHASSLSHIGHGSNSPVLLLTLIHSMYQENEHSPQAQVHRVASMKSYFSTLEFRIQQAGSRSDADINAVKAAEELRLTIATDVTNGWIRIPQPTLDEIHQLFSKHGKILRLISYFKVNTVRRDSMPIHIVTCMLTRIECWLVCSVSL